MSVSSTQRRLFSKLKVLASIFPPLQRFNLFRNSFIVVTRLSRPSPPRGVINPSKYISLLPTPISTNYAFKEKWGNGTVPLIQTDAHGCIMYSKTEAGRGTLRKTGKFGSEAFNPDMFHQISKARLEELKKKLMEMKAAIARHEAARKTKK